MKIALFLFFLILFGFAFSPKHGVAYIETAFVDSSGALQIPMIYVEGGTFNMGSNYDGTEAAPVHTVTLNNFYIGKWEVTQAQWQLVMGSNPSIHTNCVKCPVENVSWNDVQAFLVKLNQLTGKKYRLPTEAEWEYAARGGNKSGGFAYSGDKDIENVAWWGGNSYIYNKPYKAWTRPVAERKANELGIYDMSGNVSEWCQDIYDKGYYANSPSNNPRGPEIKLTNMSKIPRVCRGGNFSCINVRELLPTHRDAYYPDQKDMVLGLRLVLQP